MFSTGVTPHLQHTFQFPFVENQNYTLVEQTPTYKKWIELVDILVVCYYSCGTPVFHSPKRVKSTPGNQLQWPIFNGFYHPDTELKLHLPTSCSISKGKCFKLM